MSENKFGPKSTALEVIKGHNLSGYEIIVTGASSGIGVETVRALALAGARIVCAVRDTEKGEKVAQQLRKETKNDKIEVEKLELDSLSSVNDFSKRYLAKKRYLNILINNAGIMACPLSYTVDGFESQIGTNYIGHFALSYALLPALKEGAKKIGKNSRVISLSSLAHLYSDVDFDDINFKKRPYDPWIAYGQSKTADIYLALALNKLYSSEGVNANSVMPGGILTGLQKHMSEEQVKGMGIYDDKGNINPLFKTIEQGASTTVWAAVAKELENKGGLYLEDCGYSKLTNSLQEGLATFRGHFPYAYNDENAIKLWNLSLKWLKLEKSSCIFTKF